MSYERWEELFGVAGGVGDFEGGEESSEDEEDAGAIGEGDAVARLARSTGITTTTGTVVRARAEATGATTTIVYTIGDGYFEELDARDDRRLGGDTGDALGVLRTAYDTATRGGSGGIGAALLGAAEEAEDAA